MGGNSQKSAQSGDPGARLPGMNANEDKQMRDATPPTPDASLAGHLLELENILSIACQILGKEHSLIHKLRGSNLLSEEVAAALLIRYDQLDAYVSETLRMLPPNCSPSATQSDTD